MSAKDRERLERHARAIGEASASADAMARIYAEYDQLPEATAKPCSQCPWLRISRPGHLGPHTPQEWLEIAHSDVPIPCHLTIEYDGQDWSGLKQCAGSAIFRTNVFKSPRHPRVATSEEPDTLAVFGTDSEFVAHHQRRRSST